MRAFLKALAVAITAVGVTLLGLAAPTSAAPPGGGPAPDPGTNIVGGENATESYPFIGSIQWKNGGHFCGASLIRPDWVVTAKHCMAGETPDTMQVRLGSTDYTSGGTVAPVKQFIEHPTEDVAVMQLDQSVPYSPIEIADSAPVGSAIRLLGWGYTCDPGCGSPVTLQQLDTTVLDDSECHSGDSVLCIDNPDDWRGACYGDSGGPAVLKVDGVWRLGGITSGGNGGLCGENPSNYMDVPFFHDWIDNVVGSAPPPPPSGEYFEKTTNVQIPDGGAAVTSSISVTGVSGNAPATLKVGVDIKHAFRGDLIIDLVAPDGTVRGLKSASGTDSAPDVNTTYTVDASSSPANGTWKLRVRDVWAGDTGFIDKWSLQF